MNTHHRNDTLPKALFMIVGLFAAVFLSIALLASCSATSDAIVDATASEAPKPTLEATVEPPAINDQILQFGQVYTYDNGVSISVSEPAPFDVSEWAAGPVEGWQNLVFTMVLTNNSEAVLQPSTFATMSSGGSEAAHVFDTGHPLGEIGTSPATAILPGQTVQWLQAYSASEPATLTMQISPGFEYTPVVFTNIAP